MLLQFNITNSMSFKDEAILDLVAGSDDLREKSLISFNKERVLPSVAIFGANAAGKSNLFKALTQAILLVRNSNNLQVNAGTGLLPFLFDKDSRKKKIRFDFVFVRKGVKYEYGFVADMYKVYEEYLYEYKTAKPTKIFERYDVNKYEYTVAMRKSLKSLEEKNTDNKLFLATATAWNCQETKEPYLWFAENIDTYNHASVEDGMIAALESDNNHEIKDFQLAMLKAADFNISDYEFKVKKGDPSKMIFPPGVTFDEAILQDMKEWKLDIVHDVNENGVVNRYKMPFNQESNGTQTFFAYGPLVYLALKTGKTIVVDEIDNGLHPMLVEYLIGLFNNPEINKNGAQLIFNTHDDNLLDLDILRRDQIYFVEKNNAGASELYALSDFSPRRNDKIQKGYLQGRYGALPNIDMEGPVW